MGPDEIFHRYVLEYERHTILVEAHSGVAGGHYAGKAIVQNILKSRVVVAHGTQIFEDIL